MISGLARIWMSVNDPQWGNRGGSNNNNGDDSGGKKPQNQGPPDIEEVWRDFNKRLSSLLKKRGGGQGGGGGGRPPLQLNPNALGGGLMLIVAVALLGWLSTGFYTVDASQRALVLRFGKYHEQTGPGLRWRLPYPIESHEVVNISSVRSLEIGYRGTERNKVPKEALMLTDDENIINIQFAVQYNITDPYAYLFTNRSPDDSVSQVAETAIREVVGKNKMDYLLNEGRADIAGKIAELMQKTLDRYESGINISRVTMQNAQPPEQVQGAFADAVKAKQDQERLKNEGQAYANSVIPEAKGAAVRLLEEAKGYRQRLIDTATGDASRFKQIYAEYMKAPEVTRNRMYLETMQQIYANTTKVMIDTKSQGNLLYLPLDKLMQAAATSTAATVSSAEPSNGSATRAARPQVRAVAEEAPPQIEIAPAVGGKNSLSNFSSSRDRTEINLRSREREVR